MLVVAASTVVGSSETPVDEGVSVDDSVVAERLTLTVVEVAGKVTTIVTLDSVVLLDVAVGNGEGGTLNDEEVLDVDEAVTLSVRQHFQLRANLSKPILPRLS